MRFLTVSFQTVLDSVGSRKIVAEVVKLSKPISFLGDLDPRRGVIKDPESGKELLIKGRALAYPFSRGSTVGPYLLYWVKKLGKEPAVILCVEPDILTVTGCALAKIPLVKVTENSFNKISSGDIVMVDFENSIMHVVKLRI